MCYTCVTSRTDSHIFIPRARFQCYSPRTAAHCHPQLFDHLPAPAAPPYRLSAAPSACSSQLFFPIDIASCTELVSASSLRMWHPYSLCECTKRHRRGPRSHRRRCRWWKKKKTSFCFYFMDAKLYVLCVFAPGVRARYVKRVIKNKSWICL